ncbi:MAG: UTP--glucose-1-phosphate uridylyltransferase, partial [Planctomycetaceae bacterium]
LIAAGLVPPGLEGSQLPLADVLGVVVGPGLGLEVVTRVNDIPKGSRLAVSTNLLAGIIAACMRATAQVGSLTGPLTEDERRLVAARAVLGEWQGGSGGGWQDSGGVWPGIKLIAGELAQPGDAEHGVSRGRLLPRHRVYQEHEISEAARQALSESLVLVHGGMAQDVGPILRMVTEKYLLRGQRDSRARATAIGLLAEIEAALAAGDIRRLAAATTRNFEGPIQDIIPWACNHYTQTLIDRARDRFGDAFWGFLMLGGMSGGGMGFFFDPQVRPRAVPFLQQLMREVKRELQDGFPFAMEPVVYDFRVNNVGTSAALQRGSDVPLPAGYYTIVLPELIRRGRHDLSPQRRSELELLAHEVGGQGRMAHAGEQLL